MGNYRARRLWIVFGLYLAFLVWLLGRELGRLNWIPGKFS
jgi:hypothetical protein